MSGTHRIGILLLVAFAFILGSVWQFAGAQAERAKVAVQKWEYRSSVSLSIKEWNELGDEGWELVAALSYGRDSSGREIIFKRPKQ
jgi:hypothetical protein